MTTLVLAMLAGAYAQDDAAALAKAAAALSGATNFTFKVESSTLGLGKGGGKGEKGGGLECMYDKTVGLYSKGQKLEFVKINDKVAFKKGKDDWTASVSDDKTQKATTAMIQGIKLPSDELIDVDKKLKSVTKGEKDTVGDKECAVYSGELTDEGAKAMVLTRKVNAKSNPVAGGKMKFFVDKDGNILKYEITGTIKTTRNGTDTETKISKTVEISNVGSTKVEIPEEAKKALK